MLVSAAMNVASPDSSTMDDTFSTSGSVSSPPIADPGSGTQLIGYGHKVSGLSVELFTLPSLCSRNLSSRMAGPEIAIGALGLAGLFNNAVDWFEYIYVAKQCAPRLQTHLLRLDNAELRLTRWGDGVGLSGVQIEDEESLEHSGSFLLDAGQKTRAEKTFKVILQKFEACQKISHSYRKGRKEDDSRVRESEIKPFGPASDAMRRYLHQRMRDISFGRRNRVSLLQKAKFAIYDEKHLIELVKDVNELIDDLYKLFPPPDEKQAELGKAELDKLMDVVRELGVVVRNNDPTLASAVQHILNQKVNEQKTPRMATFTAMPTDTC